jgi:hypothetical protein
MEPTRRRLRHTKLEPELGHKLFSERESNKINIEILQTKADMDRVS